ncbi:MAG: hypothetical protein ACD_15C00037G0017 [uncultured bacterium]|nr:MAG: hypothetical protein ACD_15C00037G0017 [uncultured bacterium]HCU71099.1 hypothetical protein [Candidatus Moranbacteria bacterium]
MNKSNHRSGGKIGGRHTTVIDAAKPVVDFLLKHPDVTSITVGYIKMRLKTAPQRIKVMEESGCLLLKVRGTASIQELRVFSKNIEKVKNDLEEKFKKALISS